MSSNDTHSNGQQHVRAHTSNGQPVAVNLDELSIAERANLMPAAWDHANVSVRGGHGITYARVHVHNGPGSGNTRNGVGSGAFALLIALVIAGFVLYGLVTAA